MNYLALTVSAILGYLLGSINISIIVGKIKGDDIRNHGSGNAGATNTLRTFGKKFAVVVLLGDALKAIIAIVAARFAAKLLGLDSEFCEYAEYLAALGAVLGHNFPLYFNFRGGKGIITSVAAIFMLDPWAGLVILVGGVIVIALTRYVSLGSMVGAVLYPIYVIIANFGSDKQTMPYYIALSVLLAVIAVSRHKKNIQRIIAGNESKLGSKA